MWAAEVGHRPPACECIRVLNDEVLIGADGRAVQNAKKLPCVQCSKRDAEIVELKSVIAQLKGRFVQLQKECAEKIAERDKALSEKVAELQKVISSERALRASAERAKSEAEREVAELEKLVSATGNRGGGVPAATGLLGPILNWLRVLALSQKLAGGTGNPPEGFTKPLIGVAKTVVVFKTESGIVCGAFAFPPWKNYEYSKDPAQSSFLFALANPKLAVPARFGFVGSADAAMGLCGPDSLQFKGARGCGALIISDGGALATDNGNWEIVSGGISTLVGLSGSVVNDVEVAEWEVYQV
jgi:hypothetical protein